MTTTAKTVSIRLGTADEVVTLESRIPEFTRPNGIERIERRLGVDGALILVAEHDGQPIAFKAGFPLQGHTFYSWTGGVAPSFRRHGVAVALMQEQERRVLATGFRKIRVKSRNAFPAMLCLLINQGYRVIGLEPVPDCTNPKIIFEKCLGTSPGSPA